MGVLITKLFNSFSPMQRRVLIMGLDGAGKTTILYKMKTGETCSTVPTVGFNIERFRYSNIQFQVWDISGSRGIQKLWDTYYDNTDAIIYVFDVSDQERYQLNKETLGKIVNDNAKNVSFLVMANKMDMTKLKSKQMVEIMNLNNLNNKKWHLQPCCALTGEGMTEGLEWLSKTLQNNRK